MANVEIDDRTIVAALKNLQSAVSDLAPAFKEIGEVLVESTKDRFNVGIGPDNQPWAENSDVTIERKGRNKPLVDEGTLADQIHYALIGSDTLEIGSSLEYAAMQQFGGEKSEFPWLWGDIPARPFLGISTTDEAEILAIIAEHLLDAIN